MPLISRQPAPLLDTRRRSLPLRCALFCALFLEEVQSSLEFELKFCALRQIDFVAAAGLHQICRECGGGRAFYSFSLVSILHASDRAHRSARGGCFRGCL